MCDRYSLLSDQFYTELHCLVKWLSISHLDHSIPNLFFTLSITPLLRGKNDYLILVLGRLSAFKIRFYIEAISGTAGETICRILFAPRIL